MQGVLVHQGVMEVLAAEHRHQAHAVLVVGDRTEVVHDRGHVLALGGEGGLVAALAERGPRVAEPLPGRVQERQVGHRPGLAVRALESAYVVAVEPGGAHPQIGGDRPQVRDQVGGLQQRPRAVEGREQVPVLAQGLAEQVLRGVALVPVHQDGEQFVPDLVAGVVVRGAFRRVECLGPVGGGQPDVGPVGRDDHALGRRLLVEPDGLLDRLHQVRGGLQPGHLRVGLDSRRGSLGHEIPQDAGLYALLAEAGQDVGDVGQIGPVRADEQHTAAAVAEARVGVQEVGGAVQGDHGLAGAGAAVDDERAAGSRADDGVLVGLDGAEDVPHPFRAVAAQAGDEGGLVVERGVVPGESVRGEHLVPVVADPAARPAVPAAAGQPHRVGVGGPEERLGRGGPPVDEQPAARAVGEAEPSDVHRLGVVGSDHVPQAQVQAEAAQGAQPGAEPVDLGVPVHRLLADAAGRPAGGVEGGGQVGDRLLQALRDGREVPLVGGGQRRVGLGGEALGKGEHAGGQGIQVSSSGFGYGR